jgi:hypothetical protein
VRKFLFEHRHSRVDALVIATAATFVSDGMYWIAGGVIVVGAIIDIVFAHGNDFDEFD